jgi:hypothetical protein
LKSYLRKRWSCKVLIRISSRLKEISSLTNRRSIKKSRKSLNRLRI